MSLIEHVTTENVAGARLRSEILQWTRQIHIANARREKSLNGHLTQVTHNRKGGISGTAVVGDYKPPCSDSYTRGLTGPLSMCAEGNRMRGQLALQDKAQLRPASLGREVRWEHKWQGRLMRAVDHSSGTPPPNSTETSFQWQTVSWCFL